MGGGRSKEGQGQLPASVFPAAARGPALRFQVWFNALLSGGLEILDVFFWKSDIAGPEAER